MFWTFWRHYTIISSNVAELPKTRQAPKERAILANSSRGKHVNATRVSSKEYIPFLGRDIYCVLNEELTCSFLSPNWNTLSGFDSEEDIGEGFKSRIAPDHVRKITNALAAGVSNIPTRFQLKHKDGQWRWCELVIGGNEHGQYQCLLHDVTELVLTQGKLEKAKLEAELATKSRSEFLANMSHELRTPLNAILGFTQMIENGTYGSIGHPKYHDYMLSIQESGSTLLSKINDLLEIANIDSGRMHINESSTDLVELLRSAIEFHSHRAFSEQIALRDHLPSKPLLAVVDRIRLLQVVTNLLSNAIKYNRSGGMVEMYCENRKDGGINIIISDNGGGIPASQLESILTAFRQDNSFFARSRDCMGLGLALSKEIVKLHQGRIDIESEIGKGTHLTIRLPAARTVKVETVPKALEACIA